MISFRITVRGLYLMVLLLVLAITSVLSQEDTYRGALQIANYKGDAVYHYRITEGDTVRTGPFLLQKSDVQSLLRKKDTSFLFKGNFKNNLPEGPWQLNFGFFTSGNTSELVDYQYRVLINGEQEGIKGTLLQGRPDGTWHIFVNSLERSEIVGTDFTSKITFENGIPQGSFQIEDTQNTLVGRFLRDGLAHDQWTLYGGKDSEIEENWYFKDGVLERVETRKEDQVNKWQLSWDTKDQLRTVPLGRGFLLALKFQSFSRDSVSFLEGLMPKLLTRNASFYHQADTIFKALGATDFYPKWKVRLPAYPLDSLEAQYVRDIRLHVHKANAISEGLLQSSQLNLLRRSDEEAAYGYALVKEVSEKWLLPLKELLQYHDLEVLKFMPRSKLMAYLWPNGTPSTTIDLSSYFGEAAHDRTFSLPEAEKLAWQGNDLRASEKVAQYALLSLQGIEKQLAAKLGQQRRQQELLGVEEKLIASNDSLQRYIQVMDDSLPKSHQRALSHIGAVAEQQLLNYASVTETSRKSTMAHELLNCFRSFNLLGLEIGELSQRTDSIREHYTDGVWNPFVAVVMEEAVKKRIFAAYTKVLVPYFIDQVQNTLSCDSAKTIQQQILNTNRRMFALRDEDTKRLERKLRKEEDPKTVLELFNLKNPATE